MSNGMKASNDDMLKAIRKASYGGRIYRIIVIPLASIKAYEMVMASEQCRDILEGLKKGDLPEPVSNLWKILQIKGPQIVRDGLEKLEDIANKK
jgi:hypothetical protein